MDITKTSQEIKNELETDLQNVQTSKDLQDLRVKYLGKKEW